MEHKYDVFISYSRNDIEEVTRLVDMLKKRIPTLSCWFDIEGIDCGDEEFDVKIVEVIKKSSYVLFIVSDNSQKSKWAKNEVAYAQNANKKVIPILLSGATLTDWFLFTFGRVDCIDSTKPEQLNKLFRDLSKWTNKPLRAEFDEKQLTEPISLFKIESIKCPHCSGEHNIGATFCENTGKKLKNACTNKSCSEYNKYVLPGNAKFCLICGQPIVNDTGKLEQKCKQLNDEIEHLKSKISLLEKEKQEKCTECKNKQQEELKNQQQRFAEQEEKYKNEISSLKKELNSPTDEIENLKKEFAKRNSNSYISGHEYVDLGLSVKWATCNVGANKPEEYGNYYAWGETTTKSSYDDDNSRTYRKIMGDISGNASYDAARANWGGTWRLPTKKEMEELKNKCTWQWTTQSGVKGYKVTGPNGNSIFLPAAGYCYGWSHCYVGEYGNYWSSTPYESGGYYAYFLDFRSGCRYVDWYYRGYGHAVRPVSE